MKYIFLPLLLLIAVAGHVYAQQDTVFNQVDSLGKRQGFWKSGKHDIVYFKDGLKDGVCREFYLSGKLYRETTYRLGKLHGPCKVYAESGMLHYEGFNKDDERDGVWVFYDYRGRLQETIEYRKGYWEGTYRLYSPKGRILVESSYVKGKQDTRCAYSDDDRHELIRMFTYDRGQMVAGKYYSAGQLIKEAYHTYEESKAYSDSLWQRYRSEDGDICEQHRDYRISPFTQTPFLARIEESGLELADTPYNQLDENKLKQGFWRVNRKVYAHWDESPVYFAGVEHYRDGQRDGRCVYYTALGRKCEESEYCNGELNGLSRLYDRRYGVLLSESVFADGLLHGVEKCYDINGKLLVERQYERGILNGMYRLYAADGAILVESNYVNGLQEGTRKVYSDDARHLLIKEIEFIKGVKVAVRDMEDGQLVGEQRSVYEDALAKQRSAANDTITDYLADIPLRRWQEQDFQALTSNGDTVFDQRNVRGKPEGFWQMDLEDTDGAHIFVVAYRSNGALHGPCIYYYGDGYKMITRHDDPFERGRISRHGPFYIYRPDGSLSKEGWFETSGWQGIVKEYAADGTFEAEQYYENSWRDGHRCEYWKSGRLKTEMFYHWGDPDGVKRTYSDEEKPVMTSETIYQSGTKRREQFYEKGLLIKERFYNKKGRRIRP